MRTLAMLAVLFVAANAHADERVPVTLHDALAALPAAPETHIGPFEVAAAEAGVSAAKAWPAPSVHVAHNTLTARATIGASIPLPVFGTIGAARRHAEAQLKVAHIESDVGARELQHKVIKAWVQLARADADVTAASITAQQAAELEVIAKGRLAAGVGADVDVTVAQAARARADIAVASAEREEDAASAELSGLLGWDPMRRLRAEGPLMTTTNVAALDKLRARIAKHPNRLLQMRRLAVAHANVDEMRAARWPVIALDGEIAIDDPTNDHKNDVMIGVTIDLPLFTHARDKQRVAEQLEAAERARLAATTSELDGKLVAAYRTWQAAEDKLQALERDVVPAQERAAALSATAYREGARDLAFALQAERDLAAVRAERNAARADAAAAYADLQMAVGDAK
jgi:cobalt-zinc-cadmium efflux system outer membrane protein